MELTLNAPTEPKGRGEPAPAHENWVTPGVGSVCVSTTAAWCVGSPIAASRVDAVTTCGPASQASRFRPHPHTVGREKLQE
jgi:hypothetical protein